MDDLKPNNERRREGEEGAATHHEAPDSVPVGQTQHRDQPAAQKGRSSRQGNKRSTDGTPNSQKV